MIVPSVPGWIPDYRENCKRINGLLAAGKTVCLYEEVPVEIDRRGFMPVTNPHELPEQAEALVWVTHRYRLPELNVHTVKLVPQTRVLGVGCRKHTEPEQMRQAFTEFCNQYDTDPHSFAVMASIDVKRMNRQSSNWRSNGTAPSSRSRPINCVKWKANIRSPSSSDRPCK